MRRRTAAASLLLMAVTACDADPRESTPVERDPAAAPGAGTGADTARPITLAFAGDVHFEGHLTELLERPARGLGPIDRALGRAHLTVVNLESAVTTRGTPDPKGLEDPAERYWFRTSPAALDVLDAAGVDVVSVANNHAVDYGPVGFSDTMRAAADAPVAVVGIGEDRRSALTPYRTTIRGTDVAVLAADSSPREGTNRLWKAGATTPGIATARDDRTEALIDAVRAAARVDDVVVVYLHWGTEYETCPDQAQRTLARDLADAGADAVVGTHTHVLQGAGWLDDTYVAYGLGGFLWYHGHRPETGVLELTVRDGRVVGDTWVPASIPHDGPPTPVLGRAADQARAEWRALRACTGLTARPDGPSPAGPSGGPDGTDDPDGSDEPAPAYASSVRRIGPALRDRMRSSHGPECPVPWERLRYLRVPFVGFDGEPHRGELVVRAAYARDVLTVFERLYDARWPIRRMRLVSDYGGDDDRSMAANNTSGYNCRTVAGETRWSDHAYGAAIDLNPVQNPYVLDGSVLPPAGRPFADLDRSARAEVPRGVIRAGDPVVRAFAQIGWEWGGAWSDPDYQHFYAGD